VSRVAELVWQHRNDINNNIYEYNRTNRAPQRLADFFDLFAVDLSEGAHESRLRDTHCGSIRVRAALV
jgi:hypothetical protein